MSLLLHSALRSESVCYLLTGSLSFSPTSGSTLACTRASTPGWTAGPKSTSPATWPPTPASGWWEKSRKACCRAPQPACPKSSTISALTSTGWSTELCSLTWLHRNRSFTEILPSCRYQIQLPKSTFKWDVIPPPLSLANVSERIQAFTANSAAYERGFATIFVKTNCLSQLIKHQ